MVKLTINLRSKWLFIFASAVCLIFLLYNVNTITTTLDIRSIHIVIYYGLIFLSAGFFWIPFQFNQEFT